MFKIIAFSILALITMTMAVGYGLLAYKLQLPPYNLAKELYFRISGVADTRHNQTPVVKTDVSALLKIKNAADVATTRDALRTVLWGADGFPEKQAVIISTNIDRSRYRHFHSLRRVDEYVHDMDYGLQSRMHLFLPQTSDSGKLVIYHEAHGGRFDYAEKFISPFLQRGHAVLGVSMPLFGFNSRPVVNLPNIGNIQLVTHNQFMYLTPEKGIPVKYFIEPIIVALNHILDGDMYKSVSMFGMSGGGWSTTIAAAVDDRIEDSYSVAGTTPIFIKREQLDDYEQNTPALYSIVNYFDIYILASAGVGRQHLQIHNQYDPAYHNGQYKDIYEKIVADAVARTGPGHFGVVMDDSHKAHQLSPAAFKLIMQEIETIR